MTSLLDVLRQNPVTSGTVVPPALASVLDSVTLPGPPPGPQLPLSGSGTAGSAPLGGALGAALSGTVAWTLEQQGADGFLVHLTGVTANAGVPAPAVQAAIRTDLGTSPPRAALTPTGAPLTVAFAGGLTIAGSPTRPASLGLDADAHAVLSARHLLLPGGFGLSLPTTEIALATTGPRLGAVEVVLPVALPIVGGLVLPADLAAHGGADVTVTVPPTPAGGTGPHVSGTLTLHLGADITPADLVPLAVSVVLELPGGGTPFGAGGPQVPETVRVRASASRPPGDPAALRVAVTAESDGTQGLAHVTEAGDPSAVAAGITTVLGPAMAARAGAAGLAALGVLYAAARGFGSVFASLGGMVLHGVTLQASATDTQVPVTVDVEGAVQAKQWDVGPLLKIAMNRPMRVRWRNVRAVVDVTAATAAEAIQLDLQGARPDVVDPGGWTVEGPGNLFEVVGSRGGSGSTWFEVDLRFTVDLGPVRVSGATIRATFADNNLMPDIGLRGLDASVQLPGVLCGGGKVTIARQLDVALWAQIVPLQVNGFVAVTLDGDRVVLSAGVDLPAPILLGPTGLGLFSLAATIGTNSGVPAIDPADPMKSLRKWKPWNGLQPSPGDLTLGAAVVVATAADDGFTANALGVVGVTVPDFALRIGLDAAFLAPRRVLADRDIIASDSDNPGGPLVVLGGLSAGGDGLDIGLAGHLSVPYLFQMDIPVAGHFGSTWWLHIGSDDGVGGARTGRPPGPMKAVVFPGLGPLEVKAGWAFLMVRGSGVDNLAGTGTSLSGFAVAAGVGFTQVFGLKPVVWAEVSASLIAAIGTRPITVWAQGRLDGRVGLGPFRVGVSALATILLSDGQVDLHFRVCAVVDLLFTDLEGCIEIGTDTTPLTQAPAPDPWPIPIVTLADGIGRLLTDPNVPGAGHLAAQNGDTPAGGWSATPTVWPDTIPLLTFPVAPIVDAGAGVRGEVHAGLSGSGRFQHEWHLTHVLLEKITDAGTATVALDAVSAWQIPADVPADAPAALTSDARQLALLTVQQGISVVHQAAPADGSTPTNVGHAGDSCHWHPSPGAGWSYGAHARRLPEPQSWRIAAWEALAGFPTGWPTFNRSVGFDVLSPADKLADLLRSVHVSGWIDDGGVVTFADPLTVDSANFLGALRLWGRTSALVEEPPPPVRHVVTLHEPVADGYLLVDTGGNDSGVLTATVTTESGARAADIEAADGPSGLWRVHLAHAGQPPATSVELTVQALRPLAILGLYATAAAMVDNADASAAGAAALAGLPTTTLVDGSGRVVLDAGARYRITVGLAYHNRVDGITQPGVAGSQSVRWFFRTSGKDPKAKAAETGGPAAAGGTPWGDTVFAPWKTNTVLVAAKTSFAARDRFDPGFLTRYLIGYTPADHDLFHFTADPVSATFRAPHIAQLATKMGRAIGLAARRTDRAASASPQTFAGDLAAVVLAEGAYGGLSAADLLGAAARQAGCPAPCDGAQLTASVPLDPQTPYELSVGLPLTGQTFNPGDPELDGITFTTSAYPGPKALIEAFNLAPVTGDLAAAPTAHGDLAVGPGGNGDPSGLAGLPDGAISDDADLEQTLARLGLSPLRGVTQPRSTVLWALTPAGWGVAGVLLESPEPLIRAARMAPQTAALDAVTLPVLRTSRAGTRALWLRRDPAVLGAHAALVIRSLDAGTAFDRRLRVEPRPRFLAGAVKAVHA
jgi:hypothetical protein